MLGDFFLFAFRPFADGFFSLPKLNEGFIAKVSVDPLTKLNGIPPQILMAGETMRASVWRVKPGGLVPSGKEMTAMKSLSPSFRIKLSTSLAGKPISFPYKVAECYVGGVTLHS